MNRRWNPSYTTGLTKTIEREIVELHRFFGRWLGGTCPATDDEFARFGDALSPIFCIVTPNGLIVRRDDLLEGVRAAHGSRPGVHLHVRDVEVLIATRGHVLASYEEWQGEPAGPDRGRISTVLFHVPVVPEDVERFRRFPGGVEWLHVHETWLPESRSDPSAEG